MLTIALGLGLLALLGAFVNLLARGKLTLDLGWGRSLHDLGPIVLRIDAPRELVFEQTSAPYLGRTPKDMQGHLEVLERGQDLVLAAHYSKLAGYTVETVETVGFEPPERVTFRHVRGPVPHALEEFRLREVDGGTELVYSGEVGIDFGVLGRLAGRYWVVPTWEGQVRPSLEDIKAAAERRAEARARREARKGARAD